MRDEVLVQGAGVHQRLAQPLGVDLPLASQHRHRVHLAVALDALGVVHRERGDLLVVPVTGEAARLGQTSQQPVRLDDRLDGRVDEPFLDRGPLGGVALALLRRQRLRPQVPVTPQPIPEFLLGGLDVTAVLGDGPLVLGAETTPQGVRSLPLPREVQGEYEDDDRRHDQSDDQACGHGSPSTSVPLLGLSPVRVAAFVPRKRSAGEGHRSAERRPSRGPAQRPQHRAAQDEDEDHGQQRA